ncbi:MAG: GNAT family N-acetyltransferase [Desulfovibrio sp.]|jgi:ribosomal protein S18 acetylase RimI-like enzyme|nr:GNAT family N-acetyltransferase [Desulfovibrio sp.]
MTAFRRATPDAAEQIARIVCGTAAGIVETLLGDLVKGVEAAALLSAGFIKGEGVYRTENVLCSMDGEEITALLFSYPSREHRVPALAEALIPARRLRAVRPFLEVAVPDSLFVNTFWVAGHLRGAGLGDALMAAAERRRRELGLSGINLFCWNDNDRALRFYARHGFAEKQRIPAGEALGGRHPEGGSLLFRAGGETA